MANEIKRRYWNSQASPLASSNVEAGTYTYTFGGDTTGAIAINADAATIEAALEALASIGSGNVGVTVESNGETVEFQGALANTNVGDLTFTEATALKQKADSLNVSNTQNGAADVSVTPSNTTTTNPVAPVSEVQQVSLTGATTGTFDLNGNATSATVSTLDTSGIQSACDTIWGSGNTSVSDLGSGNFTVTFQGSFASQDVGEMSVTNNSTDGSPSVSTTTGGVVGVHQVDTCTFSGTATGGAMSFAGSSLAYNVDATTLGLILGAASASGTPASGTITTTWNDYTSHMALTATADTLVIAGQPQVVRVEATDSPTEGEVTATFNGNGASWAYNNSSPTPPTGFTLTSGATCDWTFTATSNASNVTCTADDSATPLRKAIGSEVVTAQEGSAEGSAGARRRRTLIARAA